MSEAFPCRPAPRYGPPTVEEILRAREEFTLHIPSLFTQQCLAAGCGEWPCPPWRRAVPILNRAGLLDINGQLRDRPRPPLPV